MPGSLIANLWSRIAWLAGVGTFLVSALWAALTYSHANRLAFERPLIERQVTLCFDITETVAKLVAAADAAAFEAERRKFWQFYWGPLVMVEGPELEVAMVEMGKQLKIVDFTGRERLSAFAYKVSRSCRNQIETTLDEGWRIRAKDLLGIKLNQ